MRIVPDLPRLLRAAEPKSMERESQGLRSFSSFDIIITAARMLYRIAKRERGGHDRAKIAEPHARDGGAKVRRPS